MDIRKILKNRRTREYTIYIGHNVVFKDELSQEEMSFVLDRTSNLISNKVITTESQIIWSK